MLIEPNIAPGFVHNLETCVGCHACVIACANENGLEPARFWRHIVTHNPSRKPDLTVFHLSLACNHCLDAPCIDGCPAVAIERDPTTGAVLIGDAKCIGCQYCSWVCPYDAPKFNDAAGVMSKCTLCHHRLLDGLQPACTSMCPTGALTFSGPSTASTSLAQRVEGFVVNGYPHFEVRPSIAFLPMTGRTPQPAPPGAELPSAEQVEAWTSLEASGLPPTKITLRGEWPLAIFTFIGIALVAWVLSSLLGGPLVERWSFVLLGIAGLSLSTLHLGRKERAWRAILNWRTSWLSREVMAYPAFLGVTFGWLNFGPENGIFPVVAAVTGVLFLTTVDGVYRAMARMWRSRWDDGGSILSAAFLCGIIAGNVWIALLFGALRFIGFMDRTKLQFGHRRTGVEFLWVLGRCAVGFVVPMLLWGPGENPALTAIAAALAGELIDRLHFYGSLDIVTPRQSMALAVKGT